MRDENQVRPGDFPIGSPESRAAARRQLKNKRDRRQRIEIPLCMPRPWRGEGPEPESWNKVPRFGPWWESDDKLVRVVYVPICWAESPSAEPPVCPDCGTPFVKTESYPGMTLFKSNCLAKHAPN
jgi:hypothetical protein